MPKVHPHRVVQDVQPVSRLLLALGVLAGFNFRRVNDLDVQVAQFGQHRVQVAWRHHLVRERVIDLIVSQMPLFLGQPDQLLHLLGQVHAARPGLVSTSPTGRRSLRLCGG